MQKKLCSFHGSDGPTLSNIQVEIRKEYINQTSTEQ